MAAQVQINHEDIMVQSNKLKALKLELEGTLKNCSDQINNLRDSGAFTGKAGQSFNETYQEWHVSATETVGLMAKFGLHLEKTSQAFGHTDEEFKITI